MSTATEDPLRLLDEFIAQKRVEREAREAKEAQDRAWNEMMADLDVAVFGKHLTPERMSLIAQRRLRRVVDTMPADRRRAVVEQAMRMAQSAARLPAKGEWAPDLMLIDGGQSGGR
jgi:hypothetical protein